MRHPDDVLFAGEQSIPVIPACEHFAGNEKFIRKAFELQVELGAVFDVTCDCEDGAPAGRERDHVKMIASLLNDADNKYGRAGVRIHDPSHDACKPDIDIIIGESGSQIAYLTIPKIASREQAARIIDYVHEASSAAGLASAPPIHALIETQNGLREVGDIAALPGLQGIVFGLLDFVSDHGGAIPDSAMRSPGQFQHRLVSRAKVEICAAALVNALVPVHNPCVVFDDESVSGNDAQIARDQFGFLRMYSIHPGQIQPIVKAMQPRPNEVARATDILLAAQAADWGPVSQDGEMHDRASYRYFWDILKRARTTGVELSTAAEERFFSPVSSTHSGGSSKTVSV